MRPARVSFLSVAAVLFLASACHHKPPVAKPTVASPQPFPSAGSGGGAAPPVSAVPPEPTPVAPDTPISVDPLEKASIDEINKNGLLKPVFFAYDSDELDPAARQILNQDAELLKTQGKWIVSVEGHSDERGSAEYNLALGERRALAAKTYLISLGIAADRLRTVSYGKEFPFDPGHDETAWSKNRRAHFMVTAK
jgi:peptidoglycan-associated lipoprotein